MIYLALSILSSSLIYSVFKWIGLKKLTTFNVILINYAVAATFGFVINPIAFDGTEIVSAAWFIPAVLLGSSFVFVFNLMASTTQQFGTSTAVVASKMALVIPVAFALFYLNEEAGWLKISGIVLAVAGVVLTMKRKDQPLENLSSSLPLLLFVLSGIIDLSIKEIQRNFLVQGEDSLFVPTLFLFAFISGSLVTVIQKRTQIKIPRLMTILSGFILGVINYYSIHFLVLALAVEGLETSVVFPLNNIGVVLLATLIGLVFFKERLQGVNKIGIAVAVLAIVLISWNT